MFKKLPVVHFIRTTIECGLYFVWTRDGPNFSLILWYFRILVVNSHIVYSANWKSSQHIVRGFTYSNVQCCIFTEYSIKYIYIYIHLSTDLFDRNCYFLFTCIDWLKQYKYFTSAILVFSFKFTLVTNISFFFLVNIHHIQCLCCFSENFYSHTVSIFILPCQILNTI